MTIRTKLLVFIPLLVLLVNSVTFFLFQSGAMVQRSYDDLLNRILLYKQSTQAVDRHLQMLYVYLVNPGDELLDKLSESRQALTELAAQLEGSESAALSAHALNAYSLMLDTFAEQEQAVMKSMHDASQASALSRYEEAEQTAAFIREEGQTLVDRELGFYQPLYEDIQAENKRMNRLGAAILLTNTILSILLAIWISRSVTGPVGDLVSRAKQISGGMLQPASPVKRSNDELGVLADAFEQMSGDLLSMMEKEKESLEKDRLVKELELQALQSQINPHFLFNTLNVLSKLALIEGAEKTSDLIVSMSNLLRYNLRNLDQPVTLRDELEHVKEYFTIQQARFRDRVRIELIVDEAALQQAIPALTLQPLVENAFLHGIAHMEKDAEIRLTVARDGAFVTVSIADNGEGMSEEDRQALLRQDAAAVKKQSSGLGTKNVFKRLQLFYGQEDLVHIASESGIGTTVTLRLPASQEGELEHV
ncbi:sensor histidine kinase [Paenibacillus sp. N4]|uniref:sensor histidine kinase n=1 Tax=Paenibacillus vietnamensis TaxID=2590547 RepID=UPI001CD19259|nr:sensor histidine kinase [Paenibacillus vietnamensis]MCA0753786.1 sensor histidine kinase [Paenibacillus vietnamensis]